MDYYVSWFKGEQENVKINDSNLWLKQLEHYGAMIFYNFYKIYLPTLICAKLSLSTTFFLYLLEYAVAGFIFGVFSQISHILEDVEWPKDKPIQKNWGVLQVLTAKDYSHDSYFWTYISGYLNYQVIHHLFPSLAPHYYAQIAPIVKETCKEFDVKYDYEESFWSCLLSHWRHLLQFQYVRGRYYNRFIEEGKKYSFFSDELLKTTS